MKITKDYQGLTRAENGDYVWDGDLISEEDIEIELGNCLVVHGNVQARALKCATSLLADRSIRAGEGITVGFAITAGGDIRAGGYISAIWSIRADRSIRAGTFIVGWEIRAGMGITAGGDIRAGRDICAGRDIRAGTFIDCENRIFAGTNIFHNSKGCNKNIICTELRHGEICSGALKITKTENGNEEE